MRLSYTRGGDPMQVTLAYGGGATRLTLSAAQRALMAGVLRSWIAKAEKDAEKEKPPAAPEPKPETKPKPKPGPVEIQPL